MPSNSLPGSNLSLTVLSLLFGLAAAVGGCNRAPQAVPAGSDGLQAGTGRIGLVVPAYEAAEAPAGTAAIVVQARLLSAPRGALDALADASRSGILDAGSLREIDEQIDSGKVDAIASPSLIVYSGQRSHTLTMNQAAFIKDLELSGAPGAGPVVVDPIISVLDTGSILDVKARGEKGEIVFEHLEVQHVFKLGSRVCVFTVPGVAERVPCEEPVLLKAGARRSSLRVREGDSLILPLESEVQQHTCQARGLGVAFEESYQPASQPPGEGRRAFFLVVSARPAPAGG